MVTMAPVPLIVMELPLGSAPSTPLKLTGEEVCVVLGKIWNVTVARTPSAMKLLSKPATKQRASPGATTLHEVGAQPSQAGGAHPADHGVARAAAFTDLALRRVGRNCHRVGRNVGRGSALRGVFAVFLRRMGFSFAGGKC